MYIKVTGLIKRKKILDSVKLEFKEKTCNAILGKNGAGKSSLFYFLTNHKNYSDAVLQTDIDTSAVFMSFQKPPLFTEITVQNFLLVICNRKHPDVTSIASFKTKFKAVLDLLEFPDHLFEAMLNNNMSAGENKKLELLSIHVMEPDIVLLDEIDTGIDLDTLISVGTFLQAEIKRFNPTVLIVTHNMDFLKYFDISKVFVLDKGKLVGTYTKSIIKQIKEKGFKSIFS